MMDFAQRMIHAPDNDTRAREIVGLTPDATLARIGLARQPSTIGIVLSYAGAVALGAIAGAGAALLLAPTSGDELQEKIRTQAKRMSRDMKKATDQVDQAVSQVRDQVNEFTQDDSTSPSSKGHGAHA